MTRLSRSLRLLAASWMLAALVAPAAPAQQDNPKPPPGEGQAQSKPEATERPKSEGSGRRRPAHRLDGTYMGRPIADVMSYLGANWLFRPEREVEEQPEKMLDALKILPGMTVADVGAGAGYQSLRLARRVGPEGVVLATDVQPQMLRMLAANAKRAGFENIKPILCTQDDPKLPEGAVDLILLVDVYHEVSDPDVALQGWLEALKPGGRIVFVEFRAEDPDVPIKPEHKMTVDQVRKEVEPQGFAFKELHEFLPWQHIIVFEKPAEAAPDDAGDRKAPDPDRRG
jgi:ubiquinone/menaquinone biosynthesis C-methylase UbiE